MYCSKVCCCKCKGFIVICPSNKGKEPEGKHLCKNSIIYRMHPFKIKDTANRSE